MDLKTLPVQVFNLCCGERLGRMCKLVPLPWQGREGQWHPAERECGICPETRGWAGGRSPSHGLAVAEAARVMQPKKPLSAKGGDDFTRDRFTLYMGNQTLGNLWLWCSGRMHPGWSIWQEDVSWLPRAQKALNTHSRSFLHDFALVCGTHLPVLNPEVGAVSVLGCAARMQLWIKNLPFSVSLGRSFCFFSF